MTRKLWKQNFESHKIVVLKDWLDQYCKSSFKFKQDNKQNQISKTKLI